MVYSDVVGESEGGEVYEEGDGDEGEDGGNGEVHAESGDHVEGAGEGDEDERSVVYVGNDVGGEDVDGVDVDGMDGDEVGEGDTEGSGGREKVGVGDKGDWAGALQWVAYEVGYWDEG